MAKKSLGARTMAGPLPAWLIGSYDTAGKPNIMTAAWCGICCSKPPEVSVSLRAATYSHAQIMARRAFTVNVPPASLVREVDFAGMVSGREGDKFAVAGLTAVKSELVDAPYVAECPLVLECKVVHVHELGLHTQFIGEILDVKVEETATGRRGKLKPEALSLFAYIGEHRAYFELGESLGKSFAIGREIAEKKA
jgi:flavin reductase (DIM6/NTAB) family NADH-FMN oxidoreductase RutF